MEDTVRDIVKERLMILITVTIVVGMKGAINIENGYRPMTDDERAEEIKRLYRKLIKRQKEKYPSETFRWMKDNPDEVRRIKRETFKEIKERREQKCRRKEDW